MDADLEITSEEELIISNSTKNSHLAQLLNVTQEHVNFEQDEVIPGTWDGLSDWQKSKLANLGENGVRCLLSSWFAHEKEIPEGSYCNATWDNIYCWPPTPKGTRVTRTCTLILAATNQSFDPRQITGDAVRICTENGTWLWGNWTNYTECVDSYEDYVRRTVEEGELVVMVQYILLIGSILSILCLGTAVGIYYHFKRLWCDRVTVHMHLLVALLLRSILLIVITEPFVFHRTSHYRNVDFICKTVLSLNLYATVASINWMFLQGVYLHGKLTTNIFDKETPFKLYYLIGWVLPLVLIVIYAIIMQIRHPVKCWKNYSSRDEIWILLGPLIFALVANLLFLINIVWILLTKGKHPNHTSDAEQFRRAVKGTVLLFPLLGINNLLFLYNPGGAYNKWFVILNTTCGSTQGIFVSILYCFVCKDVREAVKREYRRRCTN